MEGRPEKAGQLARDRHGHLGRWLMLFHEAPEAPTESLLRLVRNRDDPPRLSFAAPRQRDADARPMLIVPRRFHQQPSDQCVPGPRDPAAPMLLSRGVLARAEKPLAFG